MCWILFIFKGSTSYIESINQQSGSSKKNICRYGTQKLPKNINIYLCNYRTVTFLATKHEKTIMACSYLNFFHTENTPKTANMVDFLRDCFVKMTFWGYLSQFLLFWIWSQCFWGSSEDQHTDTAGVVVYANSLKQLW